MPAIDLSTLSDGQLRALERRHLPVSDWTDEELTLAARAAQSKAVAEQSSPGLTAGEVLRAAGRWAEAYDPAIESVANALTPAAQAAYEANQREVQANAENAPKVVAYAARNLAAPVVGTAVAMTGYGLPAATMLAAGAGAAGNALANVIEGRPGSTMENLNAGAVQGIGMALPAVGRVTSPALAAARPGLAMALETGAGVVGGGAAGVGLDALQQAAMTGKVDWKQALQVGGVTALLGGIGGGLNALEAGRLAAADRQGLMQAARGLGWKGNNFEDLRGWYADMESAARDLARQKNQYARRAGAPADEGAAVSPEQIQGAPENYARTPAPVEPAAPITPAAAAPVEIQPVPAQSPAPRPPVAAAPLALPAAPVVPALPAAPAAAAPDLPPAKPVDASPAAPEEPAAVAGGAESTAGSAGLPTESVAAPEGKPTITLPTAEAAQAWIAARPKLKSARVVQGADGFQVFAELKGARRRFAPRADGVVDIIDTIQELGGIPPRPRQATGGEWDGYQDTFGGRGKRLVNASKRGLGIDQWLQNLQGTEFEHLATDPGAFMGAVQQAFAARDKLKIAGDREEQQARFAAAAFENKGRAAGEAAATPAPVDALNVGATFKVKREKFEVKDINPDTGAVIAQDGPRFGTVELPAGAMFYPDKRSLKKAPATSASSGADDPFSDNFVPPESAASVTPPAAPAAPAPTADEMAAWRQQMAAERAARGWDPSWPLIEQDMGNPSVRAAVESDPTLSPEVKVRMLAFPKPGDYSEVTTPPAAPAPAAPIPPAPGQQDIFSGGETGGDTTFNLAPQDGKDFTGIVDQQAEAQAAKAAQAAAQGQMFGEDPTAGGGSSGAYGAPAFHAAPPTQPPRNQPAEARDPNFTELPIELPEAVQFWRAVSQGQYPRIRERLRVLNGNAAGVFYAREGDLSSVRIELKADIFNLVSLAEKRQLLEQAVAYAKVLKQVDPSVDEKEVIRAKFESLVREAEKAAIAAGPRRALGTFWHEIGHWADFVPDATMARGNILGRLASLVRNSKAYIGEGPGITADAPNANERAKLRRQAEKELRAQVEQIVETIRTEEPVFREIPITAEHITGIVKQLAREEFPEFYDWFSRLERPDKVAVLKQAMRGIVDERAAKFGRREPTGETKIVEKQVTRSTGPEVTPEAIRARYEELLRAELKRRGLISEKDIRRELEAAVAWWRGTKTVPDYFKPSVELWADTMSIFFNAPRALAERAPTFYRAFMQWMSAKPALKAAYDKLQEDIRSGQIYRDRVMNLRDMFTRDEAAGLGIEKAGSERDWQHVRDTLRLLFDRQFGPMERRIRATEPTRLGEAALSAIDKYIYRTTGWEAYALGLRQQVEVPLAAAGLSHNDFAEYLFHKRITDGSRRDLANPLGWNPKNSNERLAEMASQFGPTKMATLEQTQAAMWSWYAKNVITLLDQAGVLSPELSAAMHDEVFYVPFNKAREFVPGQSDAIESLIKLHHGNDAAGKVYSQVGNLGEIRSPYVQMTMRAFGLISLAHKQVALKSIVRWLQEYEPTAITEAETRFNGRKLEVVDVENARVMTLYTLQQGKIKAYYVPRTIGEMFSSGSPLEQMVISLAQRVLGPFKAVLTELNPGFWPIAAGKDVGGAVLQMPRGARLILQLPQAYLGARATFGLRGRGDLAQAALDRLMLISKADPRGEHLGHSDEATRILLRMGKDPVLWNNEVSRIERVWALFWNAWKRQGQILERTVKIAAMMHLDKQFPAMSETDKRRMVHEYGGSPNFAARGRHAPTLELAANLIFYNAWKESLRSLKRAAAEDPRGFWLKFIAAIGLPAAALWAMESGAFNGGMSPAEAEDYRQKLRAIPENDKLRGFPIVLGWADQKQEKVAYLLLPFPDSFRSLHAVWRKIAQTMSGQNVGPQGLGDLVRYTGQDVPGGHPLVAEGQKWWQYFVEGRNPYNNFTGRGALDQDAVTAGTAGKELLAQSFSNLTGGMLWRLRPERPGENLTELETFLRQPLVSNLLGRWVRVSNRGRMDEFQSDTVATQKNEAAMRIIGEEMISQTLKGLPLTKAQTSLMGESPYLVNYYVQALPRIAAGASGPLLKALGQAKSTAEKAAILTAENQRKQQQLERLNPKTMVPAGAP